MKKLSFQEIVYAVLPIGFLSIGYLNIFAQILGLYHFETLRLGIVYGLLGSLSVLLFLYTVKLWNERPAMRKTCLCFFLIPVAYALFSLAALFCSSDRRAFIVNVVPQFCYLLNGIFTVVILLTERSLARYLTVFRRYLFALSPILLLYGGLFYYINDQSVANNLGNVDYMTVGYLLLTACIALLLDFLLSASRSRQVTDAVGLAFFSAILGLNGTRGSILCLIACVIFCFVFLLARRGLSRRTALPLVCMVLSLALFETLFSPGQYNRTLEFVSELQSASQAEPQAESQTEPQAESQTEPQAEPQTEPQAEPQAEDLTGIPTQEEIYRAVALSQRIGGEDLSPFDALMGHKKIVKTQDAFAAGLLTQDEYTVLFKAQHYMTHTSLGARMILLHWAMDEIRSAPLTGHGPYAYTDKYGNYPHNLFLELATDFGVPLSLTVLLFGLYVFIRLIRRTLRAPLPYGPWLFYTLSLLPQMMVSGTLYGNAPFLQYGICIILAFLPASKNAAVPAEEIPEKETETAL